MNRTIKNLGMRATMTLLTLFCSLTGVRATEVTVGDMTNASGNGGLPMDSYSYHSYSQQIFTAEEIGIAGTINSITLWLKGNNNQCEQPFDIYMVETDKEQFVSATDWVPLYATNIVYSGAVTVLNTEYQEFTFELTTPFEYSGQHNLLIAFNKTTNDWANDLWGMSNYSEDRLNRSISAARDDSPYNPVNPTFEAFCFTPNRNVVKFDIMTGSTIGDGGTEDYIDKLPMNSYYKYSYSQQLFTAEEIGSPGTINSVTLWLYNGNSDGEQLPEMKFDIYLKEVDKEAYESLTDWVAVAESNMVYTGSLTVNNTSAKAYTFKFTKPFNYSGKNNLLLCFNNRTGAWKKGLKSKVFIASDNVIWAVCAYQDGTSYDPVNIEGTNMSYTTTKRNVVNFDITPGITVGDLDNAGNSTSTPMRSSEKYSYSQQIYTAEELGTAGTINSITLWMKGGANLPDMSYDLYMVETDKASFTSSSDWLKLNTVSIVCSGTLTVHNTDYQEYTFTLKDPFIYSGKGNLLIAFNKRAETSSSGLCTKGITATDNVSRNLHNYGSSGYAPDKYVSSGYSSAWRNVMRFDITPCTVADNPPATLEATDITYNSATLKWTGGTQFNNVEYKKEGEEQWVLAYGDLSVETSCRLNSLEENTVYYARVQSIDDNGNVSVWKTVQFATPHEVSDLECIAETATTATLSWTENGTATQWYVGYVDDLGNSYGCEADSNPFTLNYLTEGRKYTAIVRAIDSDIWSEPVTFEPTSKTVIGRGTATNSDLPTHTNYYYSLTEQLYTKEELGEAGSILSIDFYSTATERTRNLDVYMVSTDKNILVDYGSSAIKSRSNEKSSWDKVSFADGRVSVNAGDLVFSGEVTFKQDAWTTITLETPFEYDGQSNVVIVVDDNTESYQSNPSFRVFSTQDYQAIYVHGYSNFDPTGSLYYTTNDSKQKNQIRVAKGALPAVMKPTQLTVSDIAPTTANLSWTSAAQSFNVRWGTDATLTEWTGSAENVVNPYALIGLEPETAYYVQVQACDPQKGNSAWATTTLTTIPTLTPPQSLQIIAMTKNSATMSWTGYQDTYTVRLSTPEYPIKSVFTQVGSNAEVTEELKQYSFDLSSYTGSGTVAIRYTKCNSDVALIVDDVSLANSQGTVLWLEDFESGNMPEGWKQMRSTGYDNVWRIYSGSSSTLYHGSSYIYSQNWSYGTDDNWLIIPNVVLGGTLTLYASCSLWSWIVGVEKPIPAAEFGVFVSKADEVTVPASVTVKSNVQSPYTFENLLQGVSYRTQVMGVSSIAGNTDWSSEMSIQIPQYMIGDVNGDFNITPADAIMILYKYFGVEQNGFIVEAADVNFDGHISPADAIEALYIYFGGGIMGGGSFASRATDPAPSDDLQPE